MTRHAIEILIAGTLLAAGCDDTKSEAKDGKTATTDKKKEGDTPKKAEEADKGKAPEADAPDPAKPTGKSGATLDEAKAFMGEFVAPGADHAALTKKLLPQPDDYAAVFEGEFAGKAQAHYDKLFADPNVKIAPNDGQTELLISQATTEDLRGKTGDAGNFPGGYEKIAANLKPGVTWFAFKFVKPGETTGMAFDGLTFVHGHWALFPKPFRIE